MRYVSHFALFVFISGLALIFTSCTEISTNVQSSGPTVQQTLTYQGPKARIAVASFKCKAAKCNGEIGSGIADMLATALFKTGKFIVLERGEGLEEIKKELNLGQSGYVAAGKAPKIGLLEGADILVVGAITAFEPDASGIKGGVGVSPFRVPFLAGIGGAKKEAYIAADIRLVDVRTGRVINATRVEGKASSWKLGGLGGTIIGTVALGGALGAYKNTPMEKAIAVMLDRAVQEIAKMVPESYYRYGEENNPAYRPRQPRGLRSSASAAYVPYTGGKTITVVGTRVNVRSGPGTNYSIVTSLTKGVRLKALGKQGSWYQIQLPDGRVGWVYERLVR